MTTLLSHRILGLCLRLDAPFPSEIHDSHELIKAWRNRQRLHVVDRPDSILCDRDTADLDPAADLGGDTE